MAAFVAASADTATSTRSNTMKLSRSSCIFCASLAHLLVPPQSEAPRAQEVKRWLEMPYVCGRDRSGRLAIAKHDRRQVYEVISWMEPVQQAFQVNGRDVTAQLFEFTFHCGAAQAVHVTDLWLASSAAQRWKAHRRGDSIAFDAGTQRVQVGPSLAQCNEEFSRHRNFDQYALCTNRARAPVQKQVWGQFPPSKAPLPEFANVTNRANISPDHNLDPYEACRRYPNLC